MKRSRLLPHLWEIQNNYGYIPDHSITEISQKLNVSKIEIESVVSFYHFFHLKPTGKYIIYLNNSIISEYKGFREVKAAFEKETGCTFGVYDKNPLFTLFETSCIGLSDFEPAALINFHPFTDLTPEKVKTIINQLKSGVYPEEIANNPVSKIQYTPEYSKTVFFRNYTIGNSLKVLKNNSADEILEKISLSKLDGHGGAFFPTATKWEYCKNSNSEQKIVICNADEGEPGTFKDKSLLRNLPGLVIEGMIIAAYVTGAEKGYIYLRAEYKYLLKKLEDTLKEFEEKGFLGENIFGINNFNFSIRVVLGAGAYVCGAETALIESLEGKRGEPRVRKYFPTEYGYLGYSTIVNNVETFAKAARIIELGTDFFTNLGTEKSKGTKILSISGDVAKPGIYEVEWGITVQEILDLCQATSPYFIQISGPSGECINNKEFERKICKEDLLCGGSIMVFNKSRGVFKILRNFIQFFKTESCGACTPCRAGNQILYEKIRKFERGLCSQVDIDEVKNWGNIIKLTSRCGLGQFSTNTFIMALDKFQDYFSLKTVEVNKNLNVEFDMESATYDYDEVIKNTQH
ncbi:NAD(P)H-dependent oxidoreductase subunit E [Lutibacter sp. B1]|uniref:NAD(P)H-dependent oxidoreductase subunit E n=1 Tax=Lutibacter sp. B1 TaxID=2725996 RepID=UPI0014576DF4|nr:NAD(P)H-dependent oxidoreductase subunit E [Lutibacter sp. B1]NLP58455.1 NADP oxidoreductase [Lutibacter sp. B1]